MKSIIGTVLSASIFVYGLASSAPPNLAKDGLPAPILSANYDYENLNLPAHFRSAELQNEDNQTKDNPITNAGVTLGRVLFYDKRLSRNNTTSCASCHLQANNFSDPERRSKGFNGASTSLHSMALTNIRYFKSGHAFWTERVDSLEKQALRPIIDQTEMGIQDIPDLLDKLAATGFYPGLFENAFGTPEITPGRIALAITQFERSLVSADSKLDRALQADKIEDVLTEQELLGYALFGGPPIEVLERNNLADIPTMGCNECHQTPAMVLVGGKTNNGLDAGRGQFKVPSLRNIEVSGPYMHDGRFPTLLRVLEHYMDNIDDGPDTDVRLRINNDPKEQFERFRRSTEEQEAVIAFLKTLTDEKFLSDPKFSDPFNWPKADSK